MLRRVPVVATVVVLAAVGLMVWLGFWQLDRLQEKQAMLAQFETALKIPGESVDLNRDQLIDYPDAYAPITVTCLAGGTDAPKSGRNLAGSAGWAHVFRCAYRSPRGRQSAVTVIGGWAKTPELVQWQGGQISGIVAPESMTERQRWHIIADPPLAGLAANARPNPADIPNNHLSYAIQWFLFALTALVIYALALRKRLAARGDAG